MGRHRVHAKLGRAEQRRIIGCSLPAKVMFVSLLASLALFAIEGNGVHAQTCSGGAEGGMDSTGSLCNRPGDVAYGTDQESTEAPRVGQTRLAEPIAIPARRTETSRANRNAATSSHRFAVAPAPR